VFEEGRHAVLLQEWHRHGTRITFYAAKSLNTRSFELRECKSPMKSALSKNQMAQAKAGARWESMRRKAGWSSATVLVGDLMLLGSQIADETGERTNTLQGDYLIFRSIATHRPERKPILQVNKCLLTPVILVLFW
jgi:hypothetical protein